LSVVRNRKVARDGLDGVAAFVRTPRTDGAFA